MKIKFLKFKISYVKSLKKSVVPDTQGVHLGDASLSRLGAKLKAFTETSRQDASSRSLNIESNKA
jgi:hypothetical protein